MKDKLLGVNPPFATGGLEFGDALGNIYLVTSEQGIAQRKLVYVATTVPICGGSAPYNGVYANGSAASPIPSSVGATISGTGGLVIDGLTSATSPYTLVVGIRVLVCNETTTWYNGIYKLTTLSGSAWTLTREADYDYSYKITAGELIGVAYGTTQGNVVFMQTQTITTIASGNPILFTKVAGFMSSVTAGTYTSATVTVDSTGRITSASNGTSVTLAGVANQTSVVTNGNTTTIGLASTIITPGAFTTTGAATMSSTLGVTGNTTLGGTLAVTGTSTFTGAATFGGITPMKIPVYSAAQRPANGTIGMIGIWNGS